MSTYEIGSIVFDKWKICRELGQGSYGTVYEIQREDFGGVYKAALKVITVPQSRTELQSVLDEGMTPPPGKAVFLQRRGGHRPRVRHHVAPQRHRQYCQL